MMKILLILVFVHFLLDWSLQDEMTKEYKCKSWFVLLVHCIIWSFGMSIALMQFGLFDWWKVWMLLVGHYCMDYWKCSFLYKKMGIKDMTSLYIDQTFHIGQVLLCLI